MREREIFVRASKGAIERHSPQRIKRSLMKEAGLPPVLAEKIAMEVSKELRKLKFVSGPLIREMVCAKLLEHGLEEARRNYTRLGVPVYDATQILFMQNKENANINYNPEFIHKQLGDQIAREYALLHIIPSDAADAHLSGDMHIHDLDYFATRPFCFMHSIPFFLAHGLRSDGLGIYVAATRPPKRLSSAMMHLAKALLISQMYFAGGQGYDDFNIWLAPYAKGLSYFDIKQAVELFIYELDISNLSRGGQTAFTSVSLEYHVPKYMRDVEVFLPHGRGKETYADYEEEARLILKAFIEVFTEGDAFKKPFHFPKPEFKLRKGDLEKEDELIKSTFDLVAKFGSPYFLNLHPEYMPEVIQSQCCRYFMIPGSEQLKKLKDGKLRFGSLQVVTINLPRCAYLAKGDDEKLFERIRRMMELSKKVFDAKREFLRKYLLNGGSPFLLMDFDGEPYFVLDEQSCNIGFVGLNEMLKAHVGNELHESREAWHFGLKTISFMQKIAKEFSDDGYRYAVVQTPAESTAHRLALLDREQFKRKAIVKGDVKKGAVYYTNSSHVYVGANIPLWERIKIESSFHPLVQGGAIMHVFLGEEAPDPNALYRLTKKIAERTLCSYFAYTKDLTLCLRCKQLHGGLKKKCPSCGARKEWLEWYSRITGYLTRVKAWNAGKRAELVERYRYKLVE